MLFTIVLSAVSPALSVLVLWAADAFVAVIVAAILCLSSSPEIRKSATTDTSSSSAADLPPVAATETTGRRTRTRSASGRRGSSARARSRTPAKGAAKGVKQVNRADAATGLVQSSASHDHVNETSTAMQQLTVNRKKKEELLYQFMVRRRVRAVVEVLLRAAALAVLLCMCYLMLVELWDTVFETSAMSPPLAEDLSGGEKEVGSDEELLLHGKGGQQQPVFGLPQMVLLAVAAASTAVAVCVVRYIDHNNSEEGPDAHHHLAQKDTLLTETNKKNKNVSHNNRKSEVNKSTLPSPTDAVALASSAFRIKVAMLLHTCAEGLAAGIVLISSSSDAATTNTTTSTIAEGHASAVPGGGSTDAYFWSLIGHNVAEGLVVATAVRAALEASTTAVAFKNCSNAKQSQLAWMLSAALSATASHCGQPMGMLLVLAAPTLATVWHRVIAPLGAVTGPAATTAAFQVVPSLVPSWATVGSVAIQSFSFGSIAAGLCMEAGPELFEAFSTAHKAW